MTSHCCLGCELTLNLACTSHHNDEVCVQHTIFGVTAIASDSHLIRYELHSYWFTVQRREKNQFLQTLLANIHATKKSTPLC